MNISGFRTFYQKYAEFKLRHYHIWNFYISVSSNQRCENTSDASFYQLCFVNFLSFSIKPNNVNITVLRPPESLRPVSFRRSPLISAGEDRALSRH